MLSGGDQLTCERQYCAQRHLMDSDTPRERLQNLEPVCEDWHTLMNLLIVRQYMSEGLLKIFFGEMGRGQLGK